MIRLLLRPREGIGGAPGALAARVLARGDRSGGEPGWRAQLARAFRTVPGGIPVAALTRQLDCGDAVLHGWVRADPAHVRADMATARLMACGDLGLAPADVEALLKPLKPVFGDAGFPISAPCPQRWYLMLPREARMPALADPHEALGAPMDEYLPAGEPGRRWRHLLNEAQIILHNHPLNAERAAAGRLPVNSLWFWGAGTLPDSVQSHFTRVVSGDPLLRALADVAGSTPADAPTAAAQLAEGDGDALVDLRDLRDVSVLERDWIGPMVAAGVDLQLDFGDGAGLEYRRAHRWRVWRRPAAQLA